MIDSKTIKVILEKIKSLSQREKAIVGGAAFLVLCLLVYFVVISPAQERARLLNRLIAQKEREFQELIVVRDQYQRLKAAEDEIVRRISAGGASISPLSLLEQLAQRSGLREQLEQMKPLAAIATPRYTIVPVQVNLKGAGLPEVIAYLYEVENAPLPFLIKRLKMKPTARAAGRLDVTLEILTFTVAGGG
jgi:type II secretory pathway component PulM